MRKKKDVEKRNKIIIGIFLTIFMVSSIGSVVVYYGNDTEETNTVTYTFSGVDYTFTLKQDTLGNTYYEVDSEADSFTAYYLPQQLSSLGLDEIALSKMKNSQYFYLTFDPYDENIQYIDWMRYDLSRNTVSNKFFLDGVLKETDNYILQKVTCGNASDQVPVIVLKESNNTNISISGNCITLEFPSYDTLKARDILVYSMRGIE